MEAVKKVAVGVLIASVSVLVLLAILSIWDFLEEDVLWKAITSICVVGFGALVILLSIKFLEEKSIGGLK